MEDSDGLSFWSKVQTLVLPVTEHLGSYAQSFFGDLNPRMCRHSQTHPHGTQGTRGRLYRQEQAAAVP